MKKYEANVTVYSPDTVVTGRHMEGAKAIYNFIRSQLKRWESTVVIYPSKFCPNCGHELKGD